MVPLRCRKNIPRPRRGILTSFPFNRPDNILNRFDPVREMLPKEPLPLLPTFNTELPYLLGSPYSCPNSVHKKPFPTSVFKSFILINATTTKICTRGFSTQAYAQAFSKPPRLPTRTILLNLIARTGISKTLKRHPFSALMHSAGELLHTP